MATTLRIMTMGELNPKAARRGAPTVVVLSSVLLLLSGLARLAYVVTQAIEQRAYMKAHDAVEGLGMFSALPIVFLLCVAAVVTLAAFVLVALALFNLRGANWSRISTWAFGGLTLLVSGGWLALRLALSRVEVDSEVPQDSIDWNHIEQMAWSEIPGWVEPVSTAAGFSATPALALSLVLLALPAANAFYRYARPVTIA